MKSRNYNEQSVIRSISKKGVKVNTVDKTVTVAKNTTTVGNGTWGKIDYLTKVHGYIVNFVTNIGSVKTVAEDSNVVNSKVVKRESKLNMAAMVKANMKKVKIK